MSVASAVAFKFKVVLWTFIVAECSSISLKSVNCDSMNFALSKLCFLEQINRPPIPRLLPQCARNWDRVHNDDIVILVYPAKFKVEFLKTSTCHDVSGTNSVNERASNKQAAKCSQLDNL
jgi:hypothetical protein